eukprot:Sspe_Gene.12935::Locus_4432_Transcript_1_1_Confidence_1.000_Length_1681::g.12935::m.12935
MTEVDTDALHCEPEHPQQASRSTKRHKDTYNLVFFILWVLGAGVLFPWNAFISAPDYFQNYYKFVAPDAELSHTEKRLWDNILTWFTVSYSTMNLIGQTIVVFFVGSRIQVSPRVLWSIGLMFLSMVIVPILAYLSVTPTMAFTVLILACGFCGFCTAFFQSTSFGLGALFPPRFTQAVMIGNGAAGLTVSLLRVVTKAAGGTDANSPSTLRLTGAIYFYLATAWLLFCIVCFIFMRRLRYAKIYVDEFRTYSRYRFEKDSVTTVDGDCEYQPSDTESVASTNSTLTRASVAAQGHMLLQPSHCEPAPAHDESNTQKRKMPIKEIAKVVAPMAFTVWLDFVITIGVYPGVVSEIPSDLGGGWFTVWLILVFNLGDVIGRSLPRAYQMPRRSLVVFGICRLVFVPLFIFCVDPRFLKSPAFPIVLVALVAMTNGYTASMSMMYGSDSPLLGPAERETAGAMMSLMLLSGITGGSYLGLLITSFVRA